MYCFKEAIKESRKLQEEKEKEKVKVES